MAPAGFGKTVALRDFIETTRLDAVRYDVNREDRTLLAFVRGLSAALEPLAPSAKAAFPAMQQRVMAAADPLHELGDWFAEHLKRVVGTIVVDDFHYAATDPAAVALLTRLIDESGDRIRWIVATRSDAGLPIASWLGYGRMDVPIGEDDLRFSAEEALVAADDAQATLDASEVEQLRELTSGWPVALAIALRTRLHAADLRSATRGTREMVYRYLAEQVFAGLTYAQQRFLLDTCVFSGFDPAIAEALGGTPELLADLRRSVAFLTMNSAAGYRYHDLFRDFLESELRRCGAAQWYDAHAAGGALLENAGDAAGALSLYAKAGANDGILRLVESAGFQLFERGRTEVLEAALDRLSESVRRENASVLGVRAVLEAGRGHFEVAERGFVAAIERAAEPALRIALVHRYAIELVRHDRDCVALLEPYANDENVPPALRVPILGTLATAYVRARRIGDAVTTVERALSRSETFSDDVRARLYQQAGYVHQSAGSRERARTYAERAVELALARGLFEVAARAYTVLYVLLHDETDDPIALLAILDRLDECARKGASRQVRVFGLLAAYDIEVERGDDVALERLDRALDEGRGAPPTARGDALLPAQALRAAWEGNFRRAYDLLAGSGDQLGSAERRALRAAEIALYAFAAGLSGEGEAAKSEALAALERCEGASRRGARSQLLLALAELARGRAGAAHRHLSEAERTLTPAMRRLKALANAVRALYRVELDQAEPATAAAALERLRAEHVGGLARLIAAIPFGRGEQQFGPGLLTPAEREILQHLVTGASTKDIAARTARSPQTVDTHIRSICRKLNCSGRREAVAVAIGERWLG
ncbi:MAG: serine/threonine-protein kinase PknK [Candidatus Eremiobacteraeota bacterium]|nr:serine/threonine-protein kinase PknK [Candidatus Eremiobacteraeota bacterium]